jgi:hypothetical protein
LGFLTSSTPCSPHDLPGLFHPGPAHGVFPSRPFSPRNAVRSLERRDPHAVGYDANAVLPPQGFARPEDPAHRAWGLAKHYAGCPLGILPLRGFLPNSPDAHRSAHPKPSHASSTRPHAGLAAGAPGHNAMNAAVLSRDRRNLLEVSYLARFLGSSVAPRCWVIDFPQGPSCVAVDRIPSSHHRRASCRNSPRKPLR